jgi:hypothetical protein
MSVLHVGCSICNPPAAYVQPATIFNYAKLGATHQANIGNQVPSVEAAHQSDSKLDGASYTVCATGAAGHAEHLQCTKETAQGINDLAEAIGDHL